MEEQRTTPRYEGKTMRLGEREYVVPSLSVKQARTLWTKIKELDTGVTVDNLPEKMQVAVEVIHAALSRNYPDITVEQVEDFVDMSNFRQLTLVVAGQSGAQVVPGSQPAAAAAQ